MKGKEKGKGKEKAESRKRQLLGVFHQSVALLQLFSMQELDLLEEILHIFVFSRGQCLAKEGEAIDYLGVVAEGRAVSRSRALELGDTIGQEQVLQQIDVHGESIIADSDGVIVALRLADLLTLPSVALRNRVVGRLAERHTAGLLGREDVRRLRSQLDEADDKKCIKLLPPNWTSFFAEMDAKEKARFVLYFPFFKLSQKDQLVAAQSRPFLLVVLQGELMVRGGERKVVGAGQTYGAENFLLGETSLGSIYCLSGEALVLIVDKELLGVSFSSKIFNSAVKIALAEMARGKARLEVVSANQEGINWTPFKRYPNAEILPLPKKPQSKSPTKPKVEVNLTAYQTLFRQQLGTQNRTKTGQSLAQSGYDRLFTLKTEAAGKEVHEAAEAERLRKDVELLSQKLKLAEERANTYKMELTETRSRLAMAEVLKQVRRLHQDDDHIRTQNTMGEGNDRLMSLKEAFDQQMKANQIQVVVARCAFRWLYLTRKHRGRKLPPA